MCSRCIRMWRIHSILEVSDPNIFVHLSMHMKIYIRAKPYTRVQITIPCASIRYSKFVTVSVHNTIQRYITLFVPFVFSSSHSLGPCPTRSIKASGDGGSRSHASYATSTRTVCGSCSIRTLELTSQRRCARMWYGNERNCRIFTIAGSAETKRDGEWPSLW